MKCSVTGCGAKALKNDPDQRCFMHSSDPLVVERRNKVRLAGGYRQKKQVDDVYVDDIQDVKKVLIETLNELRSSPSQNVISKSRAICSVCEILMQVMDKAETKEKNAKIEELVSGIFSQ